MHSNRNDRRKFLADLSLLAGASAPGLPAFAQKQSAEVLPADLVVMAAGIRPNTAVTGVPAAESPSVLEVA